MKNILISILAFGSFSAFANEKPGDCQASINQAIYAEKIVTQFETTRSTLKMVKKEDILSDRFEENLQAAENEAREWRGLALVNCKD